MRIECFKKTRDDWYGSYKFDGDYNHNHQQDKFLCRVGFLRYRQTTETTPPGYKVYASGNDDFSLEKEFSHDDFELAQKIFLTILGEEYISKDFLMSELGFEHG